MSLEAALVLQEVYFLRRYTQTFLNEQAHIVRTAGITNSTAIPPPLPDMLGSQAEIKLRVRRWSTAITQPQTYSNPSPGWLTCTIIIWYW